MFDESFKRHKGTGEEYEGREGARERKGREGKEGTEGEREGREGGITVGLRSSEWLIT